MAQAPGKYQSQVMNFFNRQVQDIKARTGEVWKKMKIAAVWGAQMALYPIYAIVQASRYALHQFTQAPSTTGSLPNSPPAADRSILSILQALGMASAPAEVEDVVSNPNAIRGVQSPALAASKNSAPNLVQFLDDSAIDLTQLAIIGIATDLDSKQLVLVAPNCQTIALTSNQHHQLNQRILWELAQYGQDYRQYLKQTRDPALLPTHFSPNTAPIVQRFWGLMHWVHQGAVAQNLDWFGERQQLSSSGPLETPTSAGLVSGGDRLQRAIAYFFGKRSVQVLSAGAAAGAAASALIQPIPAQGLTRAEPSTRLSTQSLVNHALAIQSGNPIAVDRSFQPAVLPEDSQKRSNLTWGSVFDIDPTDSWIEADATAVGYIKHPLERFMGWLDGCFSWLEYQISALWQRLRTR